MTTPQSHATDSVQLHLLQSRGKTQTESSAGFRRGREEKHEGETLIRDVSSLKALERAGVNDHAESECWGMEHLCFRL